jgi:hypothetical protein
VTCTRWLLLKRPDNLTEGDWPRLIDLVLDHPRADRTAYGFRTYRVMEIALYHTLGAPEPAAPDRLC